MRPEGEVLKNHLHAALAHRHVIDGRTVDEDRATVGLFEAGDEAQCGGFSATAFADDDEKFAAVDIEIGLIDSGYRTESFREPA